MWRSQFSLCAKRTMFGQNSFRIRYHGHQSLKSQSKQFSASSKTSDNPFVLNPKYANFKRVQENRPLFDTSAPVTISQPPKPGWKYGEGTSIFSEVQDMRHSEIDPFAFGRTMLQNYLLLISGVPRPISFISTVSSDGSKNLSPFSYFQVVDHDPPIFVVGFSARESRPKDTRRNLTDTGECVINIVSEHMIEAVNATSLDLPYGVSEWELSGLTAAPSSTVKPERVKDAIFSIEGRLLEMKDLDYSGYHAKKGKPSGALAIIEGTRFWVREDALTESLTEIDLEKFRPLVQLGGMAYGRVRETFELPRPKIEAELRDTEKGLANYLPTR